MNPALFTALLLAWDAPPEATSFRVWRGIDVVATVDRPQGWVELPAGEASTLTVTAVGPGGESARSAPLVVWVPPVPRLTIEGSADLVTWHDGLMPGDRFARVRVER